MTTDETILVAVYADHDRAETIDAHVLTGRLGGALYEPTCQRLLPLDENWQIEMGRVKWPTVNSPEILGSGGRCVNNAQRTFPQSDPSTQPG